MTINFYLDSKLLKDGVKNLYCAVRGIEKGQKINLNTQIKLNPGFWNNEKQNVRKTFENSNELNIYIDKMNHEIRRLYFEFIQKSNNNSSKGFKLYLNDNLFIKQDDEVKKLTIYNVFDFTARITLPITTMHLSTEIFHLLLYFPNRRHYIISIEHYRLS